MAALSAQILELTYDQWRAFQASLYERDDRLDVKKDGESYPSDEQVDAYVLSGHAEALQSSEIDGDLWGTLEDLEETAQTELEAWDKIKAFYFAREFVMVRITDARELEEWFFSEKLLRHLDLIS